MKINIFGGLFPEGFIGMIQTGRGAVLVGGREKDCGDGYGDIIIRAARVRRNALGGSPITRALTLPFRFLGPNYRTQT